MTARRLQRLPRAELGGRLFPLAADRRSRLLGLAGLDRAEAMPGLLIPECACVHTCWMRFPLDLHFIDAGGALLGERLAVPPRRLAWEPGAAMVLERPAPGPAGDAPLGGGDRVAR